MGKRWVTKEMDRLVIGEDMKTCGVNKNIVKNKGKNINNGLYIHMMEAKIKKNDA